MAIFCPGCEKKAEDKTPQQPPVVQNGDVETPEKPVVEPPKVEDPKGKPGETPSSPEQAILNFELPRPVFQGTPQNIDIENLEKPLGKPRPPFLAPTGVKNLAAGILPTSSDDMPIIGDVDYITDGDKEGTDGSFVELVYGLQHVTIDLGSPNEIYAILFWHYHRSPRVYKDVIVQVADDEDFTQNVRTVFSNDHDNSAGLGVGTDRHYVETSEGKLVDAKGHVARYVRLYSNGSSDNDQNCYVEVEVFGRPTK
jgi:hypothetical protein